jgi:beta-N-acetylhexosaminidase
MMEACQRAQVEVWVLDRPEPMGGHRVAGPMIDHDLMSFIGVHHVPQVYGLTPGEWARMIQAERTPSLTLRVIPMDNWRRGMTFGELGWLWVAPSPHIPRWESCYFYAMTGTIGEYGKVSEGVGTPLPFELIGAPWLDGNALAAALDARNLKGVVFRPASFTPRYGGFSGQLCHGVQIHLVDPEHVSPTAVSRELMVALNQLSPPPGLFAEIDLVGEPSLFLKALGDRGAAASLKAGRPLDADLERAQIERSGFLKRREQYLLYK